jgi:hypothetical protein
VTEPVLYPTRTGAPSGGHAKKTKKIKKRQNKKSSNMFTELFALQLTRGVFGHEWHENKVLNIHNTEFLRYGRSKMPIGI